MKASLNWLKDYVNVKVSAKALADKLTMAGLEVGAIETINNDSVFEMEITANRADCLSILGIAQEAAAVLGAKLKSNKIKSKYRIQKSKTHYLKSNYITIKDKKGCVFYRGCLIVDVKIEASPNWLKQRLESLGVRSVNNIVDITNYCLLEYGQPLHAFDYDKLRECIIVRRAKKKEKILTIDGEERELNEDILVISDKDRAVAIAGVMGDKLSEVGALTKNILLESAYFDPVMVRKASRKLGISTESSYRFERGVDFDRVIQAQDRAIAMICDIAGGKAISIQESGKKIKHKKQKIKFNCNKANKILSLDFNPAKVKKIFESLGFKVKNAEKNMLVVDVPFLRRDIKLEEDLIEECARMYGYDKIPSTMPAIRSRPIENIESEKLKTPLRQIICSLGFDEVITYSLVSKDSLDAIDIAEAVKLFNPLSSEQEYLQPTLISGLLQCLSYNVNRANKDLLIFELGHIIDSNYCESMSLALLATGKSIDDWKVQKDADFFALKGTVETALTRLGVENVNFTSLEDSIIFLENESARIVCDDKEIGVLGRIKNDVLLKFGIKHGAGVFCAEIAIDKLCEITKKEKKFKSLAIYPSVTRDISLLVTNNVKYENILALIQSEAYSYLRNIRLTDLYKGKQIPNGCVSITIALEFGLVDRTLKDHEVNDILGRITQRLKSDLDIQIR